MENDDAFFHSTKSHKHNKMMKAMCQNWIEVSILFFVLHMEMKLNIFSGSEIDTTV